MGKYKISRGNSGCLAFMIGGIIFFCFLTVMGALTVGYGDGVGLSVFVLVCGVAGLLGILFTYFSRGDESRPFIIKKGGAEYTYYVGIEEDKFNTFGERTVRASGLHLPARGSCEIGLSATVEINKRVKWALRLRTGGSVGQLLIGAQMLFKTVEGEIIEIHNSVGSEPSAEYSYQYGQAAGVVARHGHYSLKPDILDALCSKELVKIRIINAEEPVDVDVTGRNVTKFFRLSRDVIEKALETEKTISSGM